MKVNSWLLGIVLLLILAAAAVFWQHNSFSDGNSLPSHGINSPEARPTLGNRDVADDPNEPPRDPRLDFERKHQQASGSTDGPSLDLEGLLNHFSRSPESLALVSFIKYDPAILLELKEHDQSLIAADILSRYLTVSEKLFWARRMQELDPDNGYGKLREAALLLQESRFEEAKEALDAALSARYITGYMGHLNKIIPEAARLLPENYLVDFVFDDLIGATSSNVSELVPFRISEVFSNMDPDQAQQFGSTYLAVLSKAATGGGFEAGNPSGFNRSALSFNSTRHSILSAVYQSAGEEAARQLDPLPMVSQMDRLKAQISAEREKLRSLSAAEVDLIISQTLNGRQASGSE